MAVVVVDALVVDVAGGVTNGTLALPDTAAAEPDDGRVVVTAVPLVKSVSVRPVMCRRIIG